MNLILIVAILNAPCTLSDAQSMTHVQVVKMFESMLNLENVVVQFCNISGGPKDMMHATGSERFKP